MPDSLRPPKADKVSSMLARISLGKEAAKRHERGRKIATKGRMDKKRWDDFQREADEELYGEKK